jgi:hypothetical protein
LLSQARFSEAYRALNGMQRRVYDAVPIAELWSFKQISAELTRQSSPMAWNIFQGCINTLKAAGLVREPSPGMFARMGVKPPMIVQPEPEQEQHVSPQPIKTRPAEAPTDRLGSLAALAARVRTMSDVAIQLHHEAVKIAEAIDTIALEMEEGHEKNAKDLADLAQLRTLLKTIGGG